MDDKFYINKSDIEKMYRVYAEKGYEERYKENIV